jgi:hypothetical protein
MVLQTIWSRILFSSYLQWLFQPVQGPNLLFSSVIIFQRGRAPWRSDQPVVRSLPTHRTAQTQNKRTHTHTHTYIYVYTHQTSMP